MLRSRSNSLTLRCAWLTACLAIMSVLSTQGFAADIQDQSWKDFQQALGQAALIGANADHAMANTAYRPIPAFSQSDLNANKLRLGFDLFHELRLSVDNSVGCNSCHSGMFGGTDGRQVSQGANGMLGKLNAPTTFNAAFNFRQFWDGRAVTLEEQALGPIENELEMAHDLGAVLSILQNDANYPTEFASVYNDGVTIANMADAIAYFQRINFTRASTPFVRHLEGEEGQLSEQALRGWQRFDEIGCASCHNGINLGGNSYQQLGSMLSYYDEHRVAGLNDVGLIQRSERDSDQHVFKVPTLHGVAETAPYYHNGSIETLELAIEDMAQYQLGRVLAQQDINDIAAFLRSLGGRPMGMAMGNAGMGRGMGMRAGMSGGMHNGGGMRNGGGMHNGAGMGRGMHSPTDTAAVSAPTPASAVTEISVDFHPAAYLAALQIINEAKENLLTEMRRIQSGEVAHFDFLQYQHLELIRHASALQFPPTTLSADIRAKLNTEAQTLLAAANQLEWTIADFLRAQAMINVLQAQSEPTQSNPLAARIGDATARMSDNRAIAQRMLGEMASSQISTLSPTLGQLYHGSL